LFNQKIKYSKNYCSPINVVSKENCSKPSLDEEIKDNETKEDNNKVLSDTSNLIKKQCL